MPPNSSSLPFEANLDAFEAWLASLPSNNPGAYLRALNEALQALNTENWPADFLPPALEKLRPILLIESHRLAQLSFSKLDELDEKAKKRFWLGIQFPGELGKAYLQVVKQENGLETGASKDLLLHIHRAIECFDIYSLRLSQVFEHCPSSFWPRIFELYATAEAGGGLNWTPDPINDSMSTPSFCIKDLFIRVITMRLATPNLLDLSHITRLHDVLKAHGNLIRLSRNPRIPGQSPDFTLNLAKANEPWPFQPDDTLITSDSTRFLYLGELRKKLTLLSQHSVSETERMDEALVAHILTRLSGSPCHQPESKSTEATLISEFEDIFTRLSILKAFSESPHAIETQGMNLEIVPMGQEPDAPDNRRVSSKSAGTFQPYVSQETRRIGWSLQRGEYPCRIKRTDTPGFYLVTPTGVSPAPSSLIAINTDNKLIQLGVTGTCRPQGNERWLPFELLAINPVATHLYLDTAPTTPQKALLGKFAANIDGEQALFIKPQKLRHGDRFTIDIDGRKRRARISRIRLWTPQIGVFEISLEPL